MQQIYSSDSFESKYMYSGNDLGYSWNPNQTFFRLWAPTAKEVTVCIYAGGTPDTDDLVTEARLSPDINGTWVLALPGNWNKFYYTYRITFSDYQELDVCDPYARSTGVNGKRAMILDMRSTDPEGWEKDTDPHAGSSIVDAVIYELHLRDLSVDSSSGIQWKGKYLGLTETNTSLKSGIPTGLDHIKSLGITHLQLLPIYDYGSVDEAMEEKPQFNWGYDPVNYNVPEGSYATDPYHGEIRVRELKEMVKALHENGISVVMDVVYNHVYHASEFCINRIVPGYFSRPDSNASGCGNDTATERCMVRKYIVDSVNFWVKEYHIDGFRFDLAGLLDTETVAQIIRSVHAHHPNVLFYGEGWNMSSKATKSGTKFANQNNSSILPEFGFFNDSIRDLLRGSVFESEEHGFISGRIISTDALKSCFMGVTPWACSPAQSINYVSCHDNHTLFDKLRLSLPDASEEELAKRNRLAAAFTILSQGVPFIHAGEEMLRTKPLGNGKLDENSYRSPDSVNSLKWNCLERELCHTTCDYYRGLIALRKAHPILRQNDREKVLSSIKPILSENPHTLAFRLKDENERVLIIFHADTIPTHFPLPDGQWELYVHDDMAGTAVLANCEGTLSIPPLTVSVLVQPKQDCFLDVAAALIQKNGKFLICQRPQHKARGLLWEFPGGKVEAGETGQEAIIRECSEELGIRVNAQESVAQIMHSYPDIHIRLTLYPCEIISGNPSTLEHQQLQWILPEEAINYPFSPADRYFLKYLLNK